MREILFRGKRTDNGTWAYGYLFCIWERTYLCWGTTNDVPNMKEVIPETIGQYTGLTDRNGKKIFEGDICRFKRFNDIYIGKIVFNVKTASFIMWYQPIVGAYGEKATQKMLLSVCDNIEVIGNIHDNPELLE